MAKITWLLCHLETIYIDNLGVEVKGITNLSLLNVYLPYGNNINESLDNYMQIIAETSALIKNCSTHEVVIMGHFNADLNADSAKN